VLYLLCVSFCSRENSKRHHSYFIFPYILLHSVSISHIHCFSHSTTLVTPLTSFSINLLCLHFIFHINISLLFTFLLSVYISPIVHSISQPSASSYNPRTSNTVHRQYHSLLIIALAIHPSSSNTPSLTCHYTSPLTINHSHCPVHNITWPQPAFTHSNCLHLRIMLLPTT